MFAAIFSNPRNRNNLILVVVASLLVSIVVAKPVSERWLQGWSNDVLHWVRHIVHPLAGKTEHSDVVVVAMTEAMEKTKKLGDTPRIFWLPIMGEVQDTMVAAGAKVVSWDIVLPLPGGRWHRKKGYDKPFLVSLLKSGRKSGKILLGQVQLVDRNLVPHKTYQRAIGGYDNIKLSNAFPDKDNVVRTIVLRQKVTEDDGSERFTTSMVSETARRGTGKEWQFPEDGRLLFGDRSIPKSREDVPRMLLNMDPARKIPVYSYADLLECDPRASEANRDYWIEHFRDKVVFFGVDLQLEDRVTTPSRLYDSDNRIDMPTCGESLEIPVNSPFGIAGVFALANGVSNLIYDTLLWRAGSVFHYSIIIIVTLGAGIAAVFLTPAKSIPVYIGSSIAVIGGFWYLFTYEYMVVPITETLSASGIIFSVFGIYRSMVLDKQRSEIQEMFGRYLDPTVVKDMVDSGNEPKLGGETRWVTLLFTDIAGYTDFSEPLKDKPELLVSIINRYFSVISEQIGEQQGYIVNLMGDAVMAMWGAPVEDEDQEVHAVETVLNCLPALEAFNKEVLEGEMGLKPLGTRFGINSGLSLVGNSGSPERMNYTANGDTVNTAARLESANKMYGTTFMIGEDTAAKIGDRYVLRLLDRLVVKGRTNSLKVYEVAGRDGEVSDERVDHINSFHSALDLYFDRQFKDARIAFEALAEGDKAARVYVERCAMYEEVPPPDAWDGAFVATSK